MMSGKILNNILLLCSLAILHGCASGGNYDDPTHGMDAAQIYSEARAKLDNEEYEEAIKYYEKLESKYPSGKYVERAQLEIAYAYYKFQEPDSAILAAERFIKLHPLHPNLDYAYYLRGLARYDDKQSLINRLFKQDPSERDPKNARKAFEYFSELVKKFPKSRYTPDAIKRMYALRDNLAKYEVHVANYYMQRGSYLAAANRAKYVVENYQKTPAVSEALEIMIKAYKKLGMNDLANDAARVLELNKPAKK